MNSYGYLLRGMILIYFHLYIEDRSSDQSNAIPNNTFKSVEAISVCFVQSIAFFRSAACPIATMSPFTFRIASWTFLVRFGDCSGEFEEEIMNTI
mmetsp:Transcript_25497/g.28519  ORF Transcript_25497/g.28519 Transcript_25497/m.28519 type:complete len:95 (+) Transcript_25497:151-435(+)